MNSTLMMQKLVLIAPLVARVVLYVLLWAVGALDRRHHRALVVLPPTPGRHRARSPKRLRKGLAQRRLVGARGRLLGGSQSVEAEIVGEALDWYDDGPERSNRSWSRRAAAAQEVRARPAVPRHAGQQRPLHRPLRHGARHRHRVPELGAQTRMGAGDGQRHERHRRGAASPPRSASSSPSPPSSSTTSFKRRAPTSRRAPTRSATSCSPRCSAHRSTNGVVAPRSTAPSVQGAASPLESASRPVGVGA